MKINYGKLAYCYILVFAAMAIGGYYNDFGIQNWYDKLIKPLGTPPNLVFPIVWTSLYAMIGAAFYLALTIEQSEKRRSRLNGWFIGMLFLHIVWSYAFFFAGQLGIALAVVIIIDILSYMILMEFWSVSKTAAWLFIPYFVWILFATYLNAAIINLNSYVIVIE